MLYRFFLAALSVLAWFALAGQLYIIIRYRNSSLGATVIQYFSYYTILTNILLAWVCTRLFIKNEDSAKNQKVLTAILVYILTVGLTYNAILRALWQPQGLQLIVDNLLHTVIPLLYLVFWIFCVRKNDLKWKDVLPWLIYPFVYLIYILVRGAVSGVYPYPFIDVNQLGYGKALINSFAVTGVIVFLSLFFVWLSRLFSKSTH
ncbi:MAG: Pr6Pr family membrane protein [Chitinophagaceae bacterium]|nr:Pr6Pr family membrane protein [Chitinophagaceae bacterium]